MVLLQWQLKLAKILPYPILLKWLRKLKVLKHLSNVLYGYFVPIVIAIALLTFLIWITLVHPGQFEDALLRYQF